MKNWKTTIGGAMLAVLVAIQPLFTDGEVNWIQVGIAGLIALIGYLLNDPKKKES